MSKEAKVPTVWVYPKAYYTMSYWAKLAGDKNREMTCFARCILEDGDAVVTDAYMVEHEGNSGAVEADDEDVVRLMVELNEKGVPPDEAFRCWVHSHPGYGSSATYLSGTDEDMIERFMSGDFLVSIVFDSAGKNPFCRIDYKNPRCSIVADCELYIPYLTKEELDEAKKEYNDKSGQLGPALRSYSFPPTRKHSSTKRSGSYTSPKGSASIVPTFSGNTDARTGSYSSMVANPSRSIQTLLLGEDDVEEEEFEGFGFDYTEADSMGDLRNQMMSEFELDDEDIQEQWLEWIADDPEAWRDMLNLRSPPTSDVKMDEYKVTDESGGSIVMIDLGDEDVVEVAEEQESETARHMNDHLKANPDIDRVATRVADGDLSKEAAIKLLSEQYEMSEDAADAALDWRTG